MHVQLLTRHGGPEHFQPAEQDLPATGDRDVLVRIAAASINPLDIKIREGLPVGAPLPAVLGCDMAGTVEAVGPGVTRFKPGDRVFGMVGGVKGHSGTLAEYIAADEALLAIAPTTLPLHASAALPLVALTALAGMNRLAVPPTTHLLLHGGTGGVGHVALQLARAQGVRVSTTVGSEAAAEVARSLGASDTINYRTEAVNDYVARLTNGEGFEYVFDTIGGDNLTRSFEATRPGGRIVTTNARATLDIGPMHARALTLMAVFVMQPLLTGRDQGSLGRQLGKIAEKVDRGQLKPLIDERTFILSEAAEAHRHLESGQACGKVIVRME